MSSSRAQDARSASHELHQEWRILDDLLLEDFVQEDRQNGYPALRTILKAFTGLDLEIQSAEVQSVPLGTDERTTAGLFIRAVDDKGQIVVLEMQRAAGEYIGKLARYQMSVLIDNEAQKGELEEVSQLWVIFVTDTDTVGDGKASELFMFRDEEGNPLGDPTRTLMVNGAYKGTDTLEGRVIHDIMTQDPEEMLIPEIQLPFARLKDAHR